MHDLLLLLIAAGIGLMVDLEAQIVVRDGLVLGRGHKDRLRPLIVAAYRCRQPTGRRFLLEQPELHLRLLLLAVVRRLPGCLLLIVMVSTASAHIFR